jgi:hypothetical protein
MGLVVATLLTLAMAVSIALTVGRLTDRPARDGAGVARIDWGPQLGHPRIVDRFELEKGGAYVGFHVSEGP